MLTVKVSELTGPALDWAVAKCEGWAPELRRDPDGQVIGVKFLGNRSDYRWFLPSTNWWQGGRILEQNRIDILGCVYGPEGDWTASIPRKNMVGWRIIQTGPTPLIAALRCYVASKFGDTIEIPEELKSEVNLSGVENHDQAD